MSFMQPHGSSASLSAGMSASLPNFCGEQTLLGGSADQVRTPWIGRAPSGAPPPGNPYPSSGSQLPSSGSPFFPASPFPLSGSAFPPAGVAYPPPSVAFQPSGRSFPPPSSAFPPPSSAFPPSSSSTFLPPGNTFPPSGAVFPPPGTAFPSRNSLRPPPPSPSVDLPPIGGAPPVGSGALPMGFNSSIPPPPMYLPHGAPTRPTSNHGHPTAPVAYQSHPSASFASSHASSPNAGILTPIGAAAAHELATPEQEDGNERWLRRFLSDRGLLANEAAEMPPRCKANNNFKICKYRERLRRAFTLLHQLQRICRENSHDDRKESDILTQAIILKSDLERLVTELQNGVGEVKADLARRRLKRTSLKRARQEKRFIDVSRSQAWLARHATIDAWQSELQQEIVDKKKAEEYKKTADATLAEVRRKIQEVGKAKQLVESLSKLRSLRKDAAEKHGLYTTPACDADFEAKYHEMLELLGARQSTYEQEETALKVMLDAEHKQSEEKELALQAAARQRQAERHEALLGRLLFGPVNDSWDEDDQSSAITAETLVARAFQDQAERSLPALLQIRYEWDAYLAPPGAPSASRVPTVWVLPDAPSSKAWASALAAPRAYQRLDMAETANKSD